MGNVLSHYYPISHEVVDKYEKSRFAQNIDIIDFAPDGEYDLIFLISTLEHVGWDDIPREPEKGLQAIVHLRSLLKPGGPLLATIPLGHNDFLDEQIKKGPIFGKEHFLRRTSEFNSWQEVDRYTLEDAHYNYPFPGANVVLVGFSTH